jgi:hypothetical protein
MSPTRRLPDSATRYEIIGVTLITDSSGGQALYNRCVTFDVDDRGAVTITVQTLGRPEDDFTFQPGPTQTLANVLGEIQDYITEQQRRIDTDPETIARREVRRAARRANAQTILEGGAS